ncbi:MAG: hypothetical protein RLZZ385_1530 [Pseudomonadota bacterium]|jgi:glucose-6-phosphate isomerase
MTGPASTPAWQRLAVLNTSLDTDGTTIRSLFDADPRRALRFTIATPELLFDYSKNLLSEAILAALLELAQQQGLPEAIEAMFAGQTINPTERRPALHVVLRGHACGNLQQDVAAVLARMEDFVGRVRSGNWRGYSGKPITDVVNIGIGGSHLGPAMVVRALRAYSDRAVDCHFLSNVDPAVAADTLAGLDGETTLFIIASKSFTTLETHQNAFAARQWFLDAGGDEAQLHRHFVAVSSNVTAAQAFGIAAENVFPMWDWVGGRYSLWSAIGMPIAMAIGMDPFRQLLAGAHSADDHFRTQPLAQNIPVLMALLTAWYSGFHGASSQVILPYSQSLELFPAFLQQLSMESLGKQTDLQGGEVDVDTGVIVWGAVGTDGQHSFHQLLHQGTRLVPADFIAVANPVTPDREIPHAHLLANCFSQSQALMDGKTLAQALAELRATGMDDEQAALLAPHKVIPGNRPSNTFLLRQLDPYTLGQLTAFYEHSVYAQSVLWNINAFDQWGVELGKKLSTPIFDALQTPDFRGAFDGSTDQLINATNSWWPRGT